jgi:hypothetical protein
MSAMSDQATHVITLDHDEYQALIAVVKYTLKEHREDYEKMFDAPMCASLLPNCQWVLARKLQHALNLYPLNEGEIPC